MATISVLPCWRRGVQVEIALAFDLKAPRKRVYRVSFVLSVPFRLYLYISIVLWQSVTLNSSCTDIHRCFYPLIARKTLNIVDSCYFNVLNFRRRRQREAAGNCRKKGEKIARHINSVSYIDKVARVVFPASFGLLNVCYWVIYVTYQEEFKWQDPPFGSISH